MLEEGWLRRQFEKAEEDVKRWPEWMRRVAGLEELPKAPPAEVLTAEEETSREREEGD